MKIKVDNFFDIHCHIVYGVDDGSKTLEQSLNMLKIAYEEGIRNIIFTPHYHKGYYKADRNLVKEHFSVLRHEVAKNFPTMSLYLGNEIYFAEDSLDDLEKNLIFTLADSRYVLLEFSTSVEFSYIKKAVRGALQYGYIPIVAHVERYSCLLEDVSLVEELTEQGAYIQVNASSVIGENGRKTKSFVKKLLKYQWVSFIATDAHRDDKRAPRLRECVEYIEKKYGAAYTNKIFCENPECIIKNQYIEE